MLLGFWYNPLYHPLTFPSYNLWKIYGFNTFFIHHGNQDWTLSPNGWTITMQRKTFWEEIRPKEIYNAKTSCSSKIPVPTLIIAQNNIHGFRLPEAWSPVSKLISELNLYYFCPHWNTSSFHIEQQDRKIFVEQKNQFPGRNFTAKYFHQKPFVGVFIRCLRFSRLIFPCLKFKDFSPLKFIYGMPDLP